MSSTYWMTRDVQYGFKPKLGTQNKFYKTLYSSFYRRTSSSTKRHPDYLYGGVFNLEFSPDSSILISAREKNAFILWDPISLEEIKVVENAHHDCVNCIKFVDSNTFATASDDTTIALWDIRNLKSRKRLLNGHRNWVKNIEYEPNQNLLISSGFDGSVFAWTLNASTENANLYKQIFHTAGLMRCKLSPDSSKLLLCTTGGFMVVIHDLNISKLAEDLDGFKPNIFRLMQMGRQNIPIAAQYKYLFKETRSRNRVEIISDFPENNDAEVISSLQIHPHGWCVVSRNTNCDESSEWTCVHDIQKYVPKSDDRCNDNSNDCPPARNNINPVPAQANGGSNSDLWEAALSIRDQRTRRINNPTRSTNPQHQFMHFIARISSGLVPNTLEEIVNGINIQAIPTTSNFNRSNGQESLPSGTNVDNTIDETTYYDNRPRLIRYILESNTGKGFIKESSFSPEGRVICSPFGYGVRLLAFNENCHELSMVNNNLGEATELIPVCHMYCHTNAVVSTKFSPKHSLFVSGSLNGQMISHHPVL